MNAAGHHRLLKVALYFEIVYSESSVFFQRIHFGACNLMFHQVSDIEIKYRTGSDSQMGTLNIRNSINFEV